MSDEQRPLRGSFMSEHPVRSSKNTQYLKDEEIQQFLDDLDHDRDGYIDYGEVEHNLDQAYDELFPPTDTYNRNRQSHGTQDAKVRHDFLRSMMGSNSNRIPRAEFGDMVREWRIPSLEQTKNQEDDEMSYIKRLSSWRKIRAYWAVFGPQVGFVALVTALILIFACWQYRKYNTPRYRAAFGWGLVVAKTCAGALYPTFFFLILSMSRYLATMLRRSYRISRFLNCDLSQGFHIRMSCLALILGTIHAIGHFTSTFVYGSDPANKEAVTSIIGLDVLPRYIDYIRSLPGFAGITALGLFYILAILSIPPVRRWNYEAFQLGHLLMFPIVGTLIAHGSTGLLQKPMFAYFVVFPALLVLVERLVRVALGFFPIDATLKVLDNETVQITAIIPSERLWKYKAGQYIFLQVPKISFFQWHPFTVSFSRGNMMRVHIKTDGNWTRKLRQLGSEAGQTTIKVGVNGPFDAPAQRFCDFNHTIIIGAGIGVTPFSGILADLQYKDDLDHGGPTNNEKSPDSYRHSPQVTITDAENDLMVERDETSCVCLSENSTENTRGLLRPPSPAGSEDSSSSIISEQSWPKPHQANIFANDYRRVDFHWLVRDRNYLLWISDLLNDVSRSQEWHRENKAGSQVDIRIKTHVTATRRDIVTHIYRWLLEMHRTKEHPASPLTGLLNPTDFGRPDFDAILDEHYEEMRQFRAARRQRQAGVDSHANHIPKDASSTSNYYKEQDELKIGVFYCGAPIVGGILADKCRELTTKGRKDGSKIEYHFMREVFN